MRIYYHRIPELPLKCKPGNCICLRIGLLSDILPKNLRAKSVHKVRNFKLWTYLNKLCVGVLRMCIYAVLYLSGS